MNYSDIKNTDANTTCDKHFEHKNAQQVNCNENSASPDDDDHDHVRTHVY